MTFVNTTTTAAPGNNSGRLFSDNILKFLLVFVCVTLITDIFTCGAIKVTKKVPYATKLLTCVTLACDSIFLSLVLFGAVLQVRTSEAYEIWNAVFSQAGKVCIVVSWLAVTLLSLERVVCLYFPHWYALNANKRNIKVFVAVCVLITVIVKLFIRYVILASIREGEYSFVTATQTSSLTVYFLGIFMVINTICYTASFRVVRKHSQLIERMLGHFRSSASSGMFVSTRNITCIIIVFQLVHVPLLISLTLPLHGEGSRKTYLTLVSMLIMCAVNPILYAWRFKECRFVMVKCLLSAFGFFTNGEYFSNRIEKMRMEVFGITGRV